MTKRRFFKDISILLISLVLGVASLLSSCDNISESQSEKTPAVPAGIILVTASVAPENKAARFAAPDALDDATNFDYSATLTVTGGSPSFLVSGTYDTSTKKVTFSFDTPSATTGITIDIYAHLKSESNPTVANAVLHATKENLSISAGTIAVGEITLSPNSGNTANGTASLSVTLPSNEYTLTASCDTGSFAVEGTSPNVTVKGNDLSAGAYTIVFTVKKGEEIVYIWKEVINIYAGMETNKWKSIADNGTVSTSDKKTIAESEIQAATLTTFFVRGATGATWYGTNLSTATASDENPGTVTRPLATVQKAIDKVKAANDGVTEYTIYVDGTFTAESGKNVAKIENKAGPHLSLSIIGLGTEKTVLTGNGTSVMLVRSGYQNYLTLSLQNLKITGGGSDSTYGGGINAGEDNNNDNSGGTIILTDCEISGNIAKTGGGISYFSNQSGDASLTLNNCVVTKNTAQYGGGIYAWRGAVVLENGTVIGDASSSLTSVVAQSNCGKNGTGIGGNLATNKGGGICLGATNKGLVIESGCYVSANYVSGSNGGGGIFIESGAELLVDKAKIESGAYIQYNYAAAGNGGGIYTDGKPITIAGNIIGNKASTNGGGIATTGGTLTFSSGAKIQDNTASNGGGIHSTSALTIPSGVEIIGNSATNGGGIYVCDGMLTVNGGIISGNEAKTTETGKTTNGGAIFVAHDESKGTTGNVVLQGGVIKCNSATYGGAVFIEPGASATIQKNTATNSIVTIGGDSSSEANEATIGGAIYNMGTLLISDGTLKNNKADVAGAIFNYSSLSITGGTISDNIATAGSSNGIYQRGSQFNVSGKFKINPSDDIYLFCDTTNSIFYTILIAGPLENAAPVATVTPLGHVNNYPVVRLKEGVTTTTLATEAPKFAVTPESDGTKWKVNASGNLEKDTVTKLATVYLNSATTDGGNDSNSGVSADNAVKTLKKAVELLDTDAENPTIIISSPYILASDETDCLSFEKTVTLKRGTSCGTNLLSINNTTTGSNVTVLIKNVVFDGNKASVPTTVNTSSLLCISVAGKATLENVVLKNNKSQNAGGGIFLSSGGTVEFVGNVEITGNEAAINGGGICFQPASGTVLEINENVTISGNNAGTNGNGIFVASGSLNFSGGAKIDPSNDVYLSGSATIKIKGNLTNVNAATITPATYSADTTVLTDGEGGNLVERNYMKFRVTPAATENWGVGSNGKLIKALGADTPISPDASDFVEQLNALSGEVTLNVVVTSDNQWVTLTTAIGNASNVTAVNLIMSEDSTVKSLSLYADTYGTFDNCVKLKSFLFSSSVTEIENYAFAGTTLLKTLTIPKNVKKIGCGLFEQGSFDPYPSAGIESVTFEETEGWYYELNGTKTKINVSNPTTNATNLKIDGSWAEGGGMLFRDDKTVLTTASAISALTSTENAGKPIDVEVSVTSTEELSNLLNALRDTTASDVTLVIDAENITELGTDGIFAGMSSLTSLEIKGSVTTIADSAFVGCGNLESVKISGNVTSIGNNAFQSCPDLTTVEIEDGLTSIGNDAFSDCANLTDIKLPKSLETIGERAFTANAAEEITIPEGVTWIKQGAFSGCANVKKITLPTTLEKMAPQAFSGCAILEEMIFKSTSVWYVDGAGYEKTTMVDVKDPGIAAGYFKPSSIYKDMYWSHEKPDELTVDEAKATLENAAEGSVVSIDVKVENASELAALIEVIKNETEAGAVDLILTEDSRITEIGTECFRYAKKLRKVVLPEGVTRISDTAFSQCEKLESISIPNTVTEIASSAFSYCYALTEITIPSSVTSIGGKVFENCTSLTSIAIENPDNFDWYYADSYIDSYNKTGTKIDDNLSNSQTNATYFKTTYLSKYWYRN